MKIDRITMAGFVFNKTWDTYTYAGKDVPEFHVQVEDVTNHIDPNLKGDEREKAIALYLSYLVKEKMLPPPPAPWQPSPGLRVQHPFYPDCPTRLQAEYPACGARSYPRNKTPQCTRRLNEGCPVFPRIVASEPPVDPNAE